MEPYHNIKYAGILSRASAFLIDIIVVLFLIMTITILSFAVFRINGENGVYFAEHQYPIIIGSYVLVAVLILYNSLMDSSIRQATLGKLAFKLQTVDINYKRLTLWRALLKYSIMWLIPFLLGQYLVIAVLMMAIPIAFTSKKQGVYDMIAGSLVIKKDVVEVVIPNQNAPQDEPDVIKEEIIEQ
jgi:Predicted membrane protein/domain